MVTLYAYGSNGELQTKTDSATGAQTRYQYDALGSNTPPEKSRNFELGAKLDSASGDATLRLALFHSTKYNERNRDEDVSLRLIAGKVLMDLDGQPMLAFMLRRLSALRDVELVVATSVEPADDAVIARYEAVPGVARTARRHLAHHRDHRPRDRTARAGP